MRCKFINPKILQWARETAGYRLDEVAEQATFKQVEAWERGAAYPTYKQLESLASRYKRPLALFFFPEVPDEEAIESSFRSLPTSQVKALPASIKLMLRKGKVFQLNLHALTDGINPAQELITAALKFSGRKNVKKLAAETRRLLGVDLDQQKKWRTADEALKNWRDALTANGVYVFKDAFDEDDYSGFCLYDDKFPIVFVNNSLTATRQIFTLFHELAHLIYRNNHIDATANDKGIAYLKNVAANYQNIERLCNEFAAEFLLPTSDFAKETKRYGTSPDGVATLAKRYGVSRAVVLRKMLTDKLISRAAYNRQASSLNASYRRITKKGGGGSFYRTRLAYLGKPYVELVLKKYDQQQISLGEAADYIGIKPSQFDHIETDFYDGNYTLPQS